MDVIFLLAGTCRVHFRDLVSVPRELRRYCTLPVHSQLFYSSSGCGKAQLGKLFVPGRAVRSFYFVTGYLPKWCNARRLVRHARVYTVRVPITQRLESNYINCGGHLVMCVSVRCPATIIKFALVNLPCVHVAAND